MYINVDFSSFKPWEWKWDWQVLITFGSAFNFQERHSSATESCETEMTYCYRTSLGNQSHHRGPCPVVTNYSNAQFEVSLPLSKGATCVSCANCLWLSSRGWQDVLHAAEGCVSLRPKTQDGTSQQERPCVLSPLNCSCNRWPCFTEAQKYSSPTSSAILLSEVSVTRVWKY